LVGWLVGIARQTTDASKHPIEENCGERYNRESEQGTKQKEKTKKNEATVQSSKATQSVQASPKPYESSLPTAKKKMR